MIDYLINVVVASRSYLMIAAVMFITAHWWRPKIAKVATWRKVKKVAYGIALVGLLVGLTSPSNTYKLTTDYNKSADLRRIELLNEQRRRPDITDISRQPQTPEQRAESAIDMRERVTQE